MIELRSGRLKARISPRGAELQSLRRGDEELLWQPQAGVWQQTAPWLFPFVGRLRGGGFMHRGRWYEMPLHGFAAQRDFELIEQDGTSARLRLRDSEATRAHYPFGFAFEIGYRLGERGLCIELSVLNTGAQTLAFGLGGHPGFPLAGDLRDWELVFEQAEAETVWRLQPEPAPLGLRAAAPEALAWSEPGRLRLHPALFERDALILDPLRSAWVALQRRERSGPKEQLRLQLGGAPQLGLWARPGAAYVCIEPWWGRDDAADAPDELLAKPQLQQLAPGQRFRRRLELGA